MPNIAPNVTMKNKMGLCAAKPKFIDIHIRAPMSVGINEKPKSAYVFLKTLLVESSETDWLATLKLSAMVFSYP